MKIEYFADTDTLHIVLAEGVADAAVDVSEDMLVDFDSVGTPIGITIEHASKCTDLTTLNASTLPLMERRKAA